MSLVLYNEALIIEIERHGRADFLFRSVNQAQVKSRQSAFERSVLEYRGERLPLGG
jgi:hypothetical protein